MLTRKFWQTFFLSLLLISLTISLIQPGPIRIMAAPVATNPTSGLANSETPNEAPALTPNQQQDPLTKIEPALLAALNSADQTDFFVWMAEKADLSPALQLKTKREKGRFVFETLRLTAERTQQALRGELDQQGVTYHPFYIANKILVRQGNRTLLLAIAARPDVARITANHLFQLEQPDINPKPPPHISAIEPNIGFINADKVWALGYTGVGSVLAGNDTGLDWDHPALINQYRGWDGQVADHNYNWWDATGTYPLVPDDGNYHGTHTSGTMVGDDGGVNQIGVAPGARTIHCKNMTDFGGGDEFTFSECFEWDLAPWDLNGLNPRPDLAPDVINNSWGFGGGGDPTFADEIAALQAAGILVEVSAGNEGPYCQTLRSPGDDRQVLTTGSVSYLSGTLPGSLSDFSSRGPSALYPTAYIPDIMAPGENIRSSIPGGGYEGGWSGTSMAGPHLSGLVGLLWSANPGLRGLITETVQIILDSAVPLTGQSGSNCGGDYNQGPNQDWGYGTIDSLAAVQRALKYGDTGTLAGTVTTDAAPLPDATIRASLYPTLTWQTTSDALGRYSMLVFSGTYTVDAQAYGYFPAHLTNITVVSGTTTTQNILLAPAPSYLVSGYVTDDQTGWPLYASINIAGYPGPSVWTDPVSGYYSVTLAAGITYTFQVNAGVPGYQVAHRSVGPLTGDQAEDFGLIVDPVSCEAPGYSLNYLYLETFEASNGGYTHNGTEDEWEWGEPMIWPDTCPSGSNCWGTDLDDYYNNYADQQLISPPIDLSTVPPGALLTAQWQQAWALETAYFDEAYAEVSINGGPWAEIWRHSEGTTKVDWTKMSHDISGAAGGNIQFRWGLVSDGSVTYEGLYVDDVAIVRGCSPLAGGLVVGNVYDDNTGIPLNGATVSNDAGNTTLTVATPTDPALPDGFYTLFSPAGQHAFTATMAIYGADIQSPTVVQSDTIRQDFNLAAGLLSNTPTPLALTLSWGDSATVPFTLTNIGQRPAAFELSELESGFEILAAPPAVEVPGYQPHWEGDSSYAREYRVPRASYRYQPAGEALHGLPADVLLLAAEDVSQIQAILQAYPDINSVDYFDARLDTPPLAQLLTYDTVVVISAYAFADPAAVGDVLADYVDGGGSVVQTVPTFYDPYNYGWGLQGRFITAGYSPFSGTGDWFLWADLGNFDAAHPIMQGVVSAGDSLRQVVDLDAEADLVAEWTDDEFIATKEAVVALNTFLGDGYAWTGDIGLIVHNSIIWLQTGGDIPWLTVSPISDTIDAGANRLIDITFDAGVPEVSQPGNYYGQLIIRDDTPYDPLNVPVTMTVQPRSDMGKISGIVTNDRSGGPVEGALITVISNTTTVFSDTTTAAGEFERWLKGGDYDVIISAQGYLTDTQTVSVSPGVTTTHNVTLTLNAPALTISPGADDEVLLLGDRITRTLILSNAGPAALQFKLIEIEGLLGPFQLTVGPPEAIPLSPTDKIEPQLQADLAAAPDEQADFFVLFGEQADLRPAYALDDWQERGQFVLDALRKTAAASQAGALAEVRNFIQTGQASTVRSHYIVNAIYIKGSKPVVEALAARPEVVSIHAARIHPLPEPQPGQTVPTINDVEWNIATIKADQVWADLGVRGEGIVVANIDTGVRYTHQALVNQYRGNLGDSYDHNYNWWDPDQVYNQPFDGNSHGSHTMGTIVGDDGGANQIGVAPGATWIAAQGCDTDYCSDGDLISSAEWMLAPWDLSGDPATADPSKRPHVVNNSWGGWGGDPWYMTYVDAWRAAGIFPAFSIGNSGPYCNSAGSPGDYPQSFSSGATDSDDLIAGFSSRGPTSFGGIKPDVSAPGVNIRSATNSGDNIFASKSGTSMASPHTAALVALMWSANPTLIGEIDQTAALIQQTALGIPDSQCGDAGPPNNVYGSGRIDAYQAVSESGADIPWLIEDPITGTVPAYHTLPITITFDASQVAEPGLYHATLRITNNDPYNARVNMPITMTVANFDLAFQPLLDTKAGDPGDIVTYTLHLTNTGTGANTFDLTLSNQSWPTLAPATVGPLAAEAAATVEITVSIPADAPGGALDVVKVAAASRKDPRQIVTATLTTLANHIYGALLSAPTTSRSVLPGTTATYTLHLTNTGNTTDSIYLAAEGHTWPVAAALRDSRNPLMLLVGPLAAGAGDQVELLTLVPADAEIGDSDSVTMIATSQAGPSQSDTAILTTRVRGAYGVALAPNTAAAANLPGLPVFYTLQIHNTGTTTDTFDATVGGNVWTTTVSPVEIGPLAPNGKSNTVVRVDIPDDAPAQANDTVLVTVTSQGDNTGSATAVLETTASTVYSLTMTIAHPALSGQAGATVTYTVQITNMGNTTDTLMISDDGRQRWQINRPDTFGPLLARKMATMEIVIEIPEDEPEQASDTAVVTITSQGDPEQSLFVTLTTTVDSKDKRVFLPVIVTYRHLRLSSAEAPSGREKRSRRA